MGGDVPALRRDAREPDRVEVYPSHADFSVRTVGLVGIGALGVSFGPALAIDSPAARDRGDFNWASTLWHEIAHSFHLAASDNEVPRWFSEGLAVHEQRKGDPGWGHQASVGFIRALASGDMRPVSELDRGFSSPRHPGEVVQSYYQSSLVFEVIEERHGFPAIVEMLEAYRDGASNEEAFDRALGVRLEDFDKDFHDFLTDRFAAALASVEGEMPEMGALPGLPELQAVAATNPRSFVARMAVGQALFAEGRLTEAAAHLEAALDLFPQYGGADGAHWFLGRIREEQGDTAAAISHYRDLLRLNESHYDGRVALGELLMSTGDDAGAAETLRHLAHIHPYEIADHERLAALMESAGDLRGRGHRTAGRRRARPRRPRHRELPAGARAAPGRRRFRGAPRGPRGTGTRAELRSRPRPPAEAAAQEGREDETPDRTRRRNGHGRLLAAPHAGPRGPCRPGSCSRDGSGHRRRPSSTARGVGSRIRPGSEPRPFRRRPHLPRPPPRPGNPPGPRRPSPTTAPTPSSGCASTPRAGDSAAASGAGAIAGVGARLPERGRELHQDSERSHPDPRQHRRHQRDRRR